MVRFGAGNTGRPKGAENRFTRLVRESFEHAHQAIGGKEGLAEWARKHPGDFYMLLVRLAPRQVELQGELGLPTLRVKDLTGKAASADA
jgi:hypothetical protein